MNEYPTLGDVWITVVEAMIRRAAMEPKESDVIRYMAQADHVVTEFSKRFIHTGDSDA